MELLPATNVQSLRSSTVPAVLTVVLRLSQVNAKDVNLREAVHLGSLSSLSRLLPAICVNHIRDRHATQSLNDVRAPDNPYCVSYGFALGA